MGTASVTAIILDPNVNMYEYAKLFVKIFRVQVGKCVNGKLRQGACECEYGFEGDYVRFLSDFSYEKLFLV